LDVLTCLDQGLSDSEIAARLFISAETVDHHVSAILVTLGAASRGDGADVCQLLRTYGKRGNHASPQRAGKQLVSSPKSRDGGGQPDHAFP